MGSTVSSSGPWRMCTMVGGPMDGQTYRERFPHGLLPSGIGLPCPSEPSGRAEYRRDPAEAQQADGRWLYHYRSPWASDVAELAATPTGTTLHGLVRVVDRSPESDRECRRAAAMARRREISAGSPSTAAGEPA